MVAAEIVARRRGDTGGERGWGAAFGTAFRAEGLRTVVLLGVVPVLVYLVTYVGVAEGSLLAVPWREGSWFYDVGHHQLAMARFHAGLEGHHPYESPSWSWFLLKRPVAFWFEDGGTYQHILSMGSPLAWWPALAVFGWLGVSWFRGNRWLGASVILVGALSAYLPWLVLGFARSQIFLWTSCRPCRFSTPRWESPSSGGAAGRGVPWSSAWQPRWRASCSSGPSPPPRRWHPMTGGCGCGSPSCERPDGAPTLELPDDAINIGPPPEGWCWI